MAAIPLCMCTKYTTIISDGTINRGIHSMWISSADNDEHRSFKIDDFISHANQWKKKNIILTVLLPRLRTRQLKYADFPSNAVTLFETSVSKYGLVIELSIGYAVLPSDNVLILPLVRWLWNAYDESVDLTTRKGHNGKFELDQIDDFYLFFNSIYRQNIVGKILFDSKYTNISKLKFVNQVDTFWM